MNQNILTIIKYNLYYNKNSSTSTFMKEILNNNHEMQKFKALWLPNVNSTLYSTWLPTAYSGHIVLSDGHMLS